MPFEPGGLRPRLATSYFSLSNHLQIKCQTTSAKIDSSHENNIFIISSPLYVFRYVYRSDIYRIVKKQKYNFHVRKKVQIKKLRRICNHRSFFICTLHYLFSIKFPLTLPTAKAGGFLFLPLLH